MIHEGRVLRDNDRGIHLLINAYKMHDKIVTVYEAINKNYLARGVMCVS